MIRIRSFLTVGVGTALTAACATAPIVPPPVATLAYARSDCAARPDLTTAISLTPVKEQATFLVSAPVGGAAGCLMRDGQGVPYTVFALPADYADKTIIAGASLEPLRIMSPTVTLLDREGQVSRTFEAADYMYRGSVFSVQFRPRENEGYVLVAADPSRVGQRYDSIAVGVVTTTVYTGYGASNWNSGIDTAQSRVFSYEGQAQVTVADTDIKEEGGASH